MSRNSPPLDVLQAWMQSALMHPAGVHAGSRAASGTRPDGTESSIPDLITGSTRLSPEARLAVYHHAYYARLLECLRLEFPAMRQAAGDEAFDGLAAGYLQAQPSSSYTLADLGRNFSEYLERTRPPRDADAGEPDFADFLIDLARLERCYSEVFDRPGPEREPSLTAQTMASIAPEQFAGSRLRLHDTVRLLTLRFPCHEYATAVRQRQPIAPPDPSITRLAVFRRAYVVRRCTLTPMQFELLGALREGRTIAESIQQGALVAERSNDLADEIRQSFADWTAAGFFREILSSAQTA